MYFQHRLFCTFLVLVCLIGCGQVDSTTSQRYVQEIIDPLPVEFTPTATNPDITATLEIDQVTRQIEPETAITKPSETEPANRVGIIMGACPVGCEEPPEGCVIKGNISWSNPGAKIYHIPGGQFYDETEIIPEDGERWFCTEIEAVENGWRQSKR